jgi:HSP20 family protein
MNIVNYKKPDLSKIFNDDCFFSPFNEMARNLFGKDTSAGLANVYETENDYKMELILPGFKKEDIKIEIESDILTISAKKEDKKEDKKVNSVLKEYVSSSFSRSFSLPDNASSDNIKAEIIDGILHMTLKKQTKTKKSKTIKID